jgi:hypothetical protein
VHGTPRGGPNLEWHGLRQRYHAGPNSGLDSAVGYHSSSLLTPSAGSQAAPRLTLASAIRYTTSAASRATTRARSSICRRARLSQCCAILDLVR